MHSTATAVVNFDSKHLLKPEDRAYIGPFLKGVFENAIATAKDAKYPLAEIVLVIRFCDDALKPVPDAAT